MAQQIIFFSYSEPYPRSVKLLSQGHLTVFNKELQTPCVIRVCFSICLNSLMLSKAFRLIRRIVGAGIIAVGKSPQIVAEMYSIFI